MTSYRDRDGLFSTTQLCAKSGCTPRQADYWARTEVIRPAVPAAGSGSNRRWTLDEIAMARVCERMSLLGCTGRIMRAAVDALRAFPVLWAGEAFILADGTIVPFGVAAGRDGWLINLAAARAYVGAEPIVWDGSTVGLEEIGV